MPRRHTRATSPRSHAGTDDSVSTATAALSNVSAASRPEPDVMVSDIAVPGEDGYSLMQRVRALKHERKRRLPRVALSAFAHEVDRQRALRAGFDLHLPKPIQPERLVGAIAELWHERHVHESSAESAAFRAKRRGDPLDS